MLTVVLSRDPQISSFYEQGLEVAMTCADLNEECQVVLEGYFLEHIKQASADDVAVKKLAQLGLYDIPCFAPESVLPFVKAVRYHDLYHKFHETKTVVF